MPNWCNNAVRLAHDDPKMIERAQDAFKRGEFLNEFIPCPPALLEEGVETYGGDQEAANDALRANNLKTLGYKSWYDWRRVHWGTKWDVGQDGDCELDATGALDLRFQSAWSAPTEAYERLEAMGFRIRALYYEPGMDFAGLYEDGDDENYPVEQALASNFGSDLDAAFGVIAEREADDAEDETGE